MKVYIIIVNYNGGKDTVECLESLLKLKYSNFQIIVIDNSPDFKSCQYIQQWALRGTAIETAFPQLLLPFADKPLNEFTSVSENDLLINDFYSKVIVAKTHRNEGFSAANNIGLNYVLRRDDFEFVWLLNNDTVVEPDSLTQLVQYMSKNKNARIGILGAKVMEYEAPDIIQSAGGGILIKPLAYSKLIGAGQKDAGQFDLDSVKMDFVAGTSMLVTKGFLREVGPMEENYFLYFEEPDWVERGKRLKWKIRYCYRARLYHKGGATTGGKGYSSQKRGSSDMSDYYFQRAKVLFTWKHFWYLVPTVYLSFFIVVLNRLRRGQFHRIKNLLRMLICPSTKFSEKNANKSAVQQ